MMILILVGCTQVVVLEFGSTMGVLGLHLRWGICCRSFEAQCVGYVFGRLQALRNELDGVFVKTYVLFIVQTNFVLLPQTPGFTGRGVSHPFHTSRQFKAVSGFPLIVF